MSIFYNKVKETQKRHRARNRKFIHDYLASHPCIDCGNANPIVLEFDHLRDKQFGIGRMAGGGHWSLDRIKGEIEKCEVRCANCHRIRHAKESSWYDFSCLDSVAVPKIKELKHGTKNCYSHHKCRCDLCKNANNKYQQKWRCNGRAF